MKRSLVIIFAVVLSLFFLRLLSQENVKQQSFQQLYNEAEKLFNGSATDSTDSVALRYYDEIKGHFKADSSNALLLYNCYERSGILKQGLAFTSQQVLQDYYAALQLKKTFHLNDSILFRLLLSAGNVHYMNGLFDSSVYYFSWAEKIIQQYPSAGLAGDLYNSLGALYTEAGDYIQSGNYFTKALELTIKNRPDLKEAIFAMSANIASSVKLSGYLDSALQLYKKLLDVKHPSLPIVNNIAGIFLNKKQPDSALHYLKSVNHVDGNYSIIINNAMAQAYMQKNDIAKAFQYLQNASAFYKRLSAQLKNNYYAATCKYLGDLMLMENKPAKAISYYQQSIVQYDYKFNDENIYTNPGNFAGDFASYNLFDALIAKADCFTVLYKQQANQIYFKAAVTTYDSAFALSDYIKKSIDNDEARLFVAEKLFSAYEQAVDFLISNSNNNSQQIIHALKWANKSRSASLAISLKENAIKQYAGLPDSLLQKEKNFKIVISRLRLQLQQSEDSSEQKELLSQINNETLQLQSLNNDFKNYPIYYAQKFAADNVDVTAIQKNILNDQTAVLFYFKSASSLHVFVVKENSIKEIEINYDADLNKNLNEYLDDLSANIVGKKYNNAPAKYLYQHLFTPLINELNEINSLVIIPDENLINIPFEAFEKNNGEYLMEDYSVTYQYALSFLQKNYIAKDQDAIAFAPFAYNKGNTEFSTLSSSAKEISVFPEHQQFLSNAATKSKFLSLADDAAIIHLATHAVVDFNEPLNSYITFYKKNNTDNNYKIYAHELYNLQLPKTQLVFLSACETGSGKISKSEGALSLSRAFAFAGCPNIITSLWKAEDKSTAYISDRFYSYVNKGYTYTQALQKAKTDLLNDASMSQFHTPNYWAHLIFIGDIQQKNTTGEIWIIVAIVITLIIAAITYLKIRLRNKNN